MLQGDSLPTGAISFFNRPDCPPGWSPFAAATGRTIVPGAAIDVNAIQGMPLSDSEDRQHGHMIMGSLSLSSVTYAGIAGEANHGVAHDGSPAMTFMSADAPAGLPYVQLLVCQKQAAPLNTQHLAPSGTLMFFAAPNCPAGWGQTMTTQGRFLVGLPKSGTADQSFGGAPLTSSPLQGPGPDPGQRQGETRMHHHDVSGSIKTTPHGIALLSGGLATGYAKDDTYSYQATSEDASASPPYIMLLQCLKL